MRKKIVLLVAALVGLLLFGVVCSPVLADNPVADPHGTPEQQWTWWRETYATKDYNQADLASYRELSNIPQCELEDGSTAAGYERICEWRGTVDGNQSGTSYVLVDGSKVLEW